MSFFSSTNLHPLEMLFDSYPFNMLEPQVDATHSLSAPTRRRGRKHSSTDFFNGPRCDLHATENGFVLEAEMCGVKREDIKLDVDEKSRRITIAGEVKSEYQREHQEDQQQQQQQQKPANGAAGKTQGGGEVSTSGSQPLPRTLISERCYGKMERSWVLPDRADLSKVSARLNDGILKVHIPYHKEEKPKTRSVTIEDGNEEGNSNK